VTDGERKRFQVAFRKLQIAVVKTKMSPKDCAMFALAMNALGWVLDEPVYRESFEKMLRHLDAMGVQVDAEAMGLSERDIRTWLGKPASEN